MQAFERPFQVRNIDGSLLFGGSEIEDHRASDDSFQAHLVDRLTAFDTVQSRFDMTSRMQAHRDLRRLPVSGFRSHFELHADIGGGRPQEAVRYRWAEVYDSGHRSAYSSNATARTGDAVVFTHLTGNTES